MRCLLKTTATTLTLLIGATCASALDGTFNKPVYEGPKPGAAGTRLDNCFALGQRCGKDNADVYCARMGYQSARRFETEKASPTMTTVGQRCTGSVCVAFSRIVCTTSASQRGKVLDWTHPID